MTQVTKLSSSTPQPLIGPLYTASLSLPLFPVCDVFLSGFVAGSIGIERVAAHGFDPVPPLLAWSVGHDHIVMHYATPADKRALVKFFSHGAILLEDEYF